VRLNRIRMNPMLWLFRIEFSMPFGRLNKRQLLFRYPKTTIKPTQPFLNINFKFSKVLTKSSIVAFSTLLTNVLTINATSAFMVNHFPGSKFQSSTTKNPTKKLRYTSYYLDPHKKCTEENDGVEYNILRIDRLEGVNGYNQLVVHQTGPRR